MSQRSASGGTYDEHGDLRRAASGGSGSASKWFVRLLIVFVVFLLGWMVWSWGQAARDDQPPAPPINEQSR
jgi:hypothetical protein